MNIRVRQTDFFVRNMRTRMPFKYGIATLLALPHLILRTQVEIDGKIYLGFAADGLPPKWFTKDPATTFEQDLADMLEVIRSASAIAEEIAGQPTVFGLWRVIYAEQSRRQRKFPPLLWNFGVTLIERAIIDGFCRATAQKFAEAVQTNSLGIDLGALYPELGGKSPSDFLPEKPLDRIAVRHTVGLSDPLTDADVAPPERIDDGLPQTLQECIRVYGLKFFKIKLCGDAKKDAERLRRIASIVAGDYAFTLDGNENYRALEPFRELCEALDGDATLKGFLSRRIFIEQPLHRDVALSDESCRALRAWEKRPAMIIDESDATFDTLPRALECGYAGTSHKNCKGVIKGIASACLAAHRKNVMLSAEDLANVGPVALLQDLAVICALGITHAERNGHHYFAGLSAFPAAIQEEILKRHRDLYHRHSEGFPTLTIESGEISTRSANKAPFGVGFEPDVETLTQLEDWKGLE